MNTQATGAGTQVFPHSANGVAGESAANAINILLVVTAVALLVTQVAVAGADTTFDGAADQVTGFLEGSAGRTATVVSVGVALLGLVAKFDWRLIAGAVGVGLTASAGPGVLSSMVSAVF